MRQCKIRKIFARIKSGMTENTGYCIFSHQNIEIKMRLSDNKNNFLFRCFPDFLLYLLYDILILFPDSVKRFYLSFHN